MELKKYEILYTAYADEIRNLWTRSVFLGAFMTLAWGGYGALQLKFIEKVEKLPLNATNGNGFNIEMYYNCTSLGLCFVLIVLSLLWIAMAKGSKFVQEAHEKHIERHTKKYGCSLFCDLRKYDKLLKDKTNKRLILFGALKPYRYSPSRINIALGWVSLAVSFVLLNWHLMIDYTIIGFVEKIITIIPPITNIIPLKCYIVILSLTTTLIVSLFIKFMLSSKSTNTNAIQKIKSWFCKILCCLTKKLKNSFCKSSNDNKQIKEKGVKNG